MNGFAVFVGLIIEKRRDEMRADIYCPNCDQAIEIDSTEINVKAENNDYCPHCEAEISYYAEVDIVYSCVQLIKKPER